MKVQLHSLYLILTCSLLTTLGHSQNDRKQSKLYDTTKLSEVPDTNSTYRITILNYFKSEAKNLNSIQLLDGKRTFQARIDSLLPIVEANLNSFITKKPNPKYLEE